MKISASKGRSTCHSTPASVHAICFMPFEVDLFMATTQSLNFICQRWQWLIHSPESMKSSASKGRNRCHTLASVHAICFMPFEADLFMASTQSLNIIWERWQWVIHSQKSMKSSASKGRNRCHTPASVHGICFMPFEADLFMASNNLSISQFCMAIRFSLFSYHHLPLIVKIDSKSKQFRLMFRTAKIDGKSKQIQANIW